MVQHILITESNTIHFAVLTNVDIPYCCFILEIKITKQRLEIIKLAA